MKNAIIKLFLALGFVGLQSSAQAAALDFKVVIQKMEPIAKALSQPTPAECLKKNPASYSSDEKTALIKAATMGCLGLIGQAQELIDLLGTANPDIPAIITKTRLAIAITSVNAAKAKLIAPILTDPNLMAIYNGL